VMLPVVQAVYFSFFRWNGLGPLQNFTGLANYTRILGDRVFVGALAHNLQFIVLSLVIQLPLALGLALLVGRGLPGRAIFRTIFFLPFVLSEVVTGVIWNFIYRPEGGLVNSLLLSMFPESKPTAWLADPDTVLYALFAVITWKYFGYHMILYLAGLQNIPAELEEAAQIDGCGRLQTLRYITIPLLGSAWGAADFRPDLDYDHRRPGRRQPYDGNLFVPFWLSALPTRLRQRDRRDHVLDLLRVFARVPARCDATRFSVTRCMLQATGYRSH
jgi:ABC-type sugar transport system permease subunit